MINFLPEFAICWPSLSGMFFAVKGYQIDLLIVYCYWIESYIPRLLWQGDSVFVASCEGPYPIFTFLDKRKVLKTFSNLHPFGRKDFFNKGNATILL